MPKRSRDEPGAVDKKLAADLRRRARADREAAAGREEDALFAEHTSGFIETEEPLERTYKVTQREIIASVPLSSAQQSWSRELTQFAPYAVRFARNGRHLLLGGRRGHVVMMDALRMRNVTELHLRDSVRDVCNLHNGTMFAVAQRKYVYVYDSSGAEVHCMKQHLEPRRLEFLPYHFLLSSIGDAGYLKYQDVSVGSLVAEHRTKLGACDCMTQNRQNAVVHLGHTNGVVTMWSPAVSTPLARVLCHHGPVRGAAVTRDGHYMATAGLDTQLKIWDLRTFKLMHAYRTLGAATDLSISERGLLAVAFNGQTQIWKDAIQSKASSPYMVHKLPGMQLHSVAFRPYEDSLALGHSKGVCSIIVPGAGEPNYDAFEANPFETRKQRREAEVANLLDKLPPETIALDPSFVGTVDRKPDELKKERQQLADEADKHNRKDKTEKKKARGRSKLAAKLKRKHKNIVDAETLALKAAREKEREEKTVEKVAITDTPISLLRFSSPRASKKSA